MAHIEIPIGKERHVTLAHFSRNLTREEGQVVVEGVEALAQVYAGLPVNMWWGFNDLMVGPNNSIPASGVEFETDIVPDFRRRLVDGLRRRGLPVSENYATWVPHITDQPRQVQPWTFIRHQGIVRLVQRPHFVDVPWPAPGDVTA